MTARLFVLLAACGPGLCALFPAAVSVAAMLWRCVNAR